MVVKPIVSPAVPDLGRAWTFADWEGLPDDGNRYEVLDGVLYMTTAPSNFHQWIVLNLYEHFGRPGRFANLGFPFMAPIGVIMAGMTPVQPHFLFVTASKVGIIHEGKIRGVPDLIVEVLSPSNRDYDEAVKLNAYARAGVPELALVDPAARQVRLYTHDGVGYGAPRLLNAADPLSFACLPGISALVQALFEGAPDTTL